MRISSAFVELMLEIIRDTLKNVMVFEIQADQEADQQTDQDNVFISKLLKILGEDTLSAAEIMEKLGLSHKPTFRMNYLQPAMKAGLIERTIPDKPNSKYQKYQFFI